MREADFFCPGSEKSGLKTLVVFDFAPFKTYGIEKTEGRVHCSNTASTLKKTIPSEEKPLLLHE